VSESVVFTRLAEVYEEFYVPSVLREWARTLAEAAGVEVGDSVLDLACGTGVLARTIVDRVGLRGMVVGVDPNEGMLAVARRKAPAIEWRVGHAEELPFEGQSFDVVACQFGLMFFGDRTRAIREMVRVLRPGGRLVAVVWDKVEELPIYAILEGLLRKHYGPVVIEEFLVPHSLGSPELLTSLFADAGVEKPRIERYRATTCFPSLREWLWIEVKEWLLGDSMDEVGFESLLGEAEELFQPFISPEGVLVSPAPGYVVTVAK
jgi:ubiquinone/menaquinone biosynthesis C-methylase UbiE